MQRNRWEKTYLVCFARSVILALFLNTLQLAHQFCRLVLVVWWVIIRLSQFVLWMSVHAWGCMKKCVFLCFCARQYACVGLFWYNKLHTRAHTQNTRRFCMWGLTPFCALGLPRHLLHQYHLRLFLPRRFPAAALRHLLLRLAVCWCWQHCLSCPL